MFTKPITFLRRVALLEALSYLLLLFIAMPLKYAFDKPQMVQWVGSIHGALFVVFGLALLICWIRAKWSFARVFTIFLISLVPFAPFFYDKKLHVFARDAGEV